MAIFAQDRQRQVEIQIVERSLLRDALVESLNVVLRPAASSSRGIAVMPSEFLREVREKLVKSINPEQAEIRTQAPRECFDVWMKALGVPRAPVDAVRKIEATFLVLAEESFHDRGLRATIANDNDG